MRGGQQRQGTAPVLELREQETVLARPIPQSEADVVFATGDVDPGDELVPGVPAVAAGDAYGIDHRVRLSGIGVLGAERIIGTCADSWAARSRTEAVGLLFSLP